MPAAERGDDRLVRIELQAAPAAEEELSFAGVLSAFLARATGSLKEVATRGEATQVSVPQLRNHCWPLANNPQSSPQTWIYCSGQQSLLGVSPAHVVKAHSGRKAA